jgi:hypothetical protein
LRGGSESLETPIDFLQHAGDCEDFAITKYMTRRSLGVAAESMRVAVVTDSQLSVAHAVLMVASEGQYYVLDNLTSVVGDGRAALPPGLRHQRAWMVELRPSSRRHARGPVYAINEHGWWNHGPQVADTPAGSMVHWHGAKLGAGSISNPEAW